MNFASGWLLFHMLAFSDSMRTLPLGVFHHAVVFDTMKLQAVLTTTFVSPLYWKGLLGVVSKSYKELEQLMLL